MSRKYMGLENKKILVVEDVELNQHLARHIMESWGCIVNVAENGLEAVEKIDNGDYDLVLMDIQMPVMDGVEATKRIRSMKVPGKAAVPIVALTANALPNECQQYMNAGMNDCMQKPFEEPTLFRIILKNIRSTHMENFTSTRPQSPAPSTAKLYDLAMVEAISGGDKTFVLKMLNLFLETVPATLRDLTAASDEKDWHAVSKIAHKLKSTIDSMSITELKQEIRVIESNGKSGNEVEKLPWRVSHVSGVMELVMAQVKKDHSL